MEDLNKLNDNLSLIKDEIVSIKILNEITSHKLTNINEHLEKLNGKVLSHDKLLTEYEIANKLLTQKMQLEKESRELDCPFRDDIETLKTDILTTSAVKIYLGRGVIVLATVIGIVWTTIKIFEHFI